MTHLETLKVMRDFYAGSVLKHPEKVAALEAAIAAMEAIGNAKARLVIPDQWDDVFAKYGNVVWCSDLEPESKVLIIPADAVGGG